MGVANRANFKTRLRKSATAFCDRTGGMLVALHDLTTSRRSDLCHPSVWRGSWDFPACTAGNLPPAVCPRAGAFRRRAGAGAGVAAGRRGAGCDAAWLSGGARRAWNN